MLHAPPTAHIVHSISSLAAAVDTSGEYNWRHRGNFSISTFTYQNLGFWGGLKGFRVEIEKSPRWLHFYPPKLSTATASEKIE